MHLVWNGALRGVPAVGVAPYRARGPGARRSLAIGEGVLVVRGMLWDGVCHCGPRMPELWVFCVLWGSAGAIGAKGASPPCVKKRRMKSPQNSGNSRADMCHCARRCMGMCVCCFSSRCKIAQNNYIEHIFWRVTGCMS